MSRNVNTDRYKGFPCGDIIGDCGMVARRIGLVLRNIKIQDLSLLLSKYN